jgi:hypothetical protein
MKRIFLLFMLAACGGDSSPADAGNNDAGNDATQSMDSSSNDSSNDSSTTDASNDGATGDGGLNAGDPCDPQNNQCPNNMLCCSEPIHGGDAMSGFFCEKPVNKGCPLLP